MGGVTLLYFSVSVGCYPMENPSASGGRVGKSPRRGSGAFTHSSGLLLSTGGLHYTILRFVVDTTTLLNTYTSQWYLDKKPEVGGWRPPLNTELGDTCPGQIIWRGPRLGGWCPPLNTQTGCTCPAYIVQKSPRMGGWCPPLTTKTEHPCPKHQTQPRSKKACEWGVIPPLKTHNGKPGNGKPGVPLSSYSKQSPFPWVVPPVLLGSRPAHPVQGHHCNGMWACPR